ncbi:NF-kappa-B-repressing factor [Nephila pilipes]|uniref:NF-kappa-B-repressing factor n=1 Tax=Nephila pilipes TaxID=299642 RepID=A0A8X6JXT3_NEPPI|nr:NF-kappa-B-repressing factor [Nephila pilipes]
MITFVYNKSKSTTESEKILMSICTITVNKEVFGMGVGSSPRAANLTATQDAVEFMQSNFYTIKVNKRKKGGFIITRQQVLNDQDSKNIISDNNIGCKMLKMMGWTGGAIGKRGGIIEPIVANQREVHQGLGFSNNNTKLKNFKQKIQGLLKDYSLSRTISDLIFSTDFSKEERKEIHQLSKGYNLQSMSIGKGKRRQLFVRKKHTPKELLEFLVEVGGSTLKYELVDKSCETSDGSTHKCELVVKSRETSDGSIKKYVDKSCGTSNGSIKKYADKSCQTLPTGCNTTRKQLKTSGKKECKISLPIL